MQSTDPEGFLCEQIPQHSTTREWQLHVELVDPKKQLQSGVPDGARFIIDAAATDPQRTGLSVDAELRRVNDCYVALGKRPALLSTPDKKSFSSVNSPIFASIAFTSTPPAQAKP